MSKNDNQKNSRLANFSSYATGAASAGFLFAAGKLIVNNIDAPEFMNQMDTGKTCVEAGSTIATLVIATAALAASWKAAYSLGNKFGSAVQAKETFENQQVMNTRGFGGRGELGFFAALALISYLAPEVEKNPSAINFDNLDEGVIFCEFANVHTSLQIDELELVQS